MKPQPIYFISDAHGIYVPQRFALLLEDNVEMTLTGVEDDTLKILISGPEHNQYWDAWEEVENEAVVIDSKGTRYNVHQDGDCWLIPVGMSWDHKTDSWAWLPEDAQ